MQITFTLNKDNYWRCSRHLLRTPALIKANVIVLGRIALVMVSLAIAMSLLAGFSWSMVFVDVFIFGLLLFALLGKRRHISVALITPGLMGQITIAIRPENLSRKSDVLETIVPWQSFVGIMRTPDGVLLLLSERVAYVIPGDAFASLAEMDGFYQTVSAYWETAKSGRPFFQSDDTSAWPPAPTGRG